MITLNKIVYPTDFSTAAEVAFDAAQRLAREVVPDDPVSQSGGCGKTRTTEPVRP